MIEQVDPETGTEGLMQVGGVGSGHDTYSHQVTGCIHEHGENKDVGGAGTKLGSVQTIQTAEEVLQENSSVNLMSWVQNISSKGKQLLQKIWGESKEANDAITSQNGNGNHIAGQETLVTGNSVDYNEQGGSGDSSYPYVFPACGSKGYHAGKSFSEGALSGTEGSEKVDGPAAGSISGIPYRRFFADEAGANERRSAEEKSV